MTITLDTFGAYLFVAFMCGMVATLVGLCWSRYDAFAVDSTAADMLGAIRRAQPLYQTTLTTTTPVATKPACAPRKTAKSKARKTGRKA